ncbi:hypothetical protein D3C76_1676020 [compost metagenome]
MDHRGRRASTGFYPLGFGYRLLSGHYSVVCLGCNLRQHCLCQPHLIQGAVNRLDAGGVTVKGFICRANLCLKLVPLIWIGDVA